MSKEHEKSGNLSAYSPAFSSTAVPASTKSVSLDSDEPPRSSLSILVAEDDSISRLFIARVLQKLGHSVCSVVNGQEVLDLLLSSEPFDLLLTDIKMPLVNGLDLSRILRSDRRYRHRLDLPIIAMTAYGSPGDRATFFKAGMDDYLPKPIDGHLLKIMLERLSDKTQ